MSKYTTASEGRKPAPASQTPRADAGPFPRTSEAMVPNGIWHAVEGAASRTLCGDHAVESLFSFPNVDFLDTIGSARNRCLKCGELAR